MKSPDQEPKSLSADLTPTVGSATDVSPIGHPLEKPAHERTAAEDADIVDWDRVARMPEFLEMIRAKLRFVVPATVFFIIYYFALPVLVGYAPALMEKKIVGVLNLAYLFALSQFFMAWVLAALYMRAAARFDRMERGVIDKALGRRGEK